MRSAGAARVCAGLSKTFALLAALELFISLFFKNPLFLVLLGTVLAGAAIGTFIARLYLLPEGEFE